jgi:[protein-PII] uridylyltransferase
MDSQDTARRGAGDEPAAPLADYFELRDRLRKGPIGDGALDTCHPLTAALDSAITGFFPAALAGELAVVAVGGYGRREQSLFSDVDIMLLHSGIDLEAVAKALLYPLWDAGLKVGHSVRTVAEAAAAADDSLETLTSLLSMRLVAGSDRLIPQLETALVKVIKGRPLSPRLIAAERRRRAAAPYPLMAADLKNGRGGLRTLQSFVWERRRAELIGASLPHRPTSDELAAHTSLLAVRNALHAGAGRAADSFVHDARDGVASWLGTDVWDVAERVVRSLRTGDRLAMERWPDMAAAGPTTGMADRLRNRFRRSPRQEPSPNRPLARAVAATTRPEGVVLTTQDRQAIQAAGSQTWTESDRRDFITLLGRGQSGRVVFGWLDRLGWIDANLPEISHTIATPQLAPFHEHPIDTHLWRTVDEMRHLIAEPGTIYSTAAAEVADRDLLLLAAFLHDIGKALPGDHSEVGAGIAGELCRRIGFGDRADLVTQLVRHHLLLAETATKRDTADPRVIEHVAAACGDLRTLQALYLLTVADARATGRTMWSHWKATLLRNLYLRVAGRLEPEGRDSRRRRIEAIAAEAATEPETIEDHISDMPPGYLDGHANDEIAAHHRLAAGPLFAGAAVEVLDPDDAAPRLVVVATDKIGVLGAISGVLALHNLEVLDARLQTRADGVACDTFHVRRLLESLPLPSAAAILDDLVAALAGEIDLAAQVAAKTAPYQRDGGDRLVVRTPTDPTLRYTAIEVRCTDQPGALFHIVAELYAAGLDIRMARIDTRGDEVRDLFYVLRDGEPIRDVNEIQPLIAGLRRALRRRLGIRPA